ncbi:MAG: quinone oxidoreductase [Betaproteobacteria bacterium]|nr:MAG: quinone oxidoreductase [Betaproteobacteria bacterium]
MTRAIRIHATGGPEVMQLDDVTLAAPGQGEARVRHTAIGVNYLDTYHRSGLYPLPLPAGIGTEGAGVVDALGPGTEALGLRVGQRVAYCGGPPGSYSEARVMPADRLVPLPDDVADRDAAALMLKGLTVEYLFHRTYPLQGGETIVFHAAAGGVGLIACQWARALGVRMIGTVSSDAKAALAREHGCAETIVYTREDFVARVKALTDGRGVPVVYDSIGKDTFPASLDCLQPRGMFVSFGSASGPIAAFSMALLAQKGSLYATRPTLFTYAAKREDLLAMADRLFAMVRKGAVRPDVRQTHRLAEAAAAHRALESRATTGATLLLP